MRNIKMYKLHTGNGISYPFNIKFTKTGTDFILEILKSLIDRLKQRTDNGFFVC